MSLCCGEVYKFDPGDTCFERQDYYIDLSKVIRISGVRVEGTAPDLKYYITIAMEGQPKIEVYYLTSTEAESILSNLITVWETYVSTCCNKQDIFLNSLIAQISEIHTSLSAINTTIETTIVETLKDLDINDTGIISAINNIDCTTDVSSIVAALDKIDTTIEGLDIDNTGIINALGDVKVDCTCEVDCSCDVDLTPVVNAINNLDVNDTGIIAAIEKIDTDGIVSAINGLDIDGIITAINDINCSTDVQGIIDAIKDLDVNDTGIIATLEGIGIDIKDIGSSIGDLDINNTGIINILEEMGIDLTDLISAIKDLDINDTGIIAAIEALDADFDLTALIDAIKDLDIDNTGIIEAIDKLEVDNEEIVKAIDELVKNTKPISYWVSKNRCGCGYTINPVIFEQN